MRRALPHAARLVRRGGIVAARSVGSRQALGRVPACTPPMKRHRRPSADGAYRRVVLGDRGSGRPTQRAVAQARERAPSETGGFHTSPLLGDDVYDQGVRSIAGPLSRHYFERLADEPQGGAVVLTHHPLVSYATEPARLHSVEGGEDPLFHTSTLDVVIRRIRPRQLDFALRDRNEAVLNEGSYAHTR